MYKTLKKLIFRFTKKPFEEQREQVLDQLNEREGELRADWLSNSANFLSLSNNKKIVNNCSFFLARQAKNIGLFLCTLGIAQFISLLVNSKRKSPSSIKELRSLESRKREIEEAKKYFQRIKDSEKDYEENKAKELEPGAEEIISYSLSSMPFSKHEEIVEKKNKDPYLRFLHIYSILISFIFTGGLILFYFIYKKSRDPRYRFLDSALSKHVIEGARFEQYLTELVRQKYEFDSIQNLNHCLGNTFKDVALTSELQTNFLKKPVLRNIFFLVTSLLTGGLFTMYMYWLSIKDNNERFNELGASKRVKEWQKIEPLGNISRGGGGRGIKAIRRFGTDLHIFSFIASTTQLAIATIFLKPLKGIRKMNQSLLRTLSEQPNRKIVNFALLLICNAFLLVWCYIYNFDNLILNDDLSEYNGLSWSFYVAMSVIGVTIFWFCYNGFLKQLGAKLVQKLGRAGAELLLPKPQPAIRDVPASNLTINTQYFRPARNLNGSFSGMFTSPLAKGMINLFLLLISYSFLLVGSIMYKFNIDGGSFYTMVASSSLFILLMGYHVFLVS